MFCLVDSLDGVCIVVYYEGNFDGLIVVLVYGFLDLYVLWDGVVLLLVEWFWIVCYDNCGVGCLLVFKFILVYIMVYFVDDFDVVIGELSFGELVYVLVYDWGLVGVWEYLCWFGVSDWVVLFMLVFGFS